MGNKVGVISNTVKDVVQSLIDDNLVETDKIGAGNFLWALPSKGQQIRVNKLDQLKSGVMECKTQKKSLTQYIQNQLQDKPDSSERLEKLQILKSAENLLENLKKQRDSLKSCTKQYYDECLEKFVKAKNNCNLFTENILACRAYLQSRNPSLSASDINKYFSIPEDLDTI